MGVRGGLRQSRILDYASVQLIRGPVRRVGRAAGRVIDADDRKVIGYGLVMVGGTGAVVLAGAGILGLAWRVFVAAAG